MIPKNPFFSKGLFFLILSIHLFAPLFFLCNVTQNPYSVQIVGLQAALLTVWGWVALSFWRPRTFIVTCTPIDRPLLVFGLWTLITWGLSYFRHGLFFRPGILHEGGRGAFFLWVNALGVFYLSSQWGKDPRRHFVRRWMLMIGGISAAYGILQYFGIDPVWGKGVNPFSGRPVSTYGNPNFLSSVLVLFLPMILQEFLKADTPATIFFWGTLGLLNTGALLSTLTRSSWMGAGIALLAYLFMERGRILLSLRRVGLWAAGTVALIVFWPASSVGNLNPVARLMELWKGITGASVYASWHQRLLIWRSAWDMWKEHPWTGKGWGLFELFFPYYQGRLVTLDLFREFRTHANNAHQLFLEYGSQTGLIGLGLVFWLAAATVAARRNSSSGLTPEERSLSAALLSGMVGMAADNIFGNVSLFFAVPSFLFFWTAGQWASLHGEEIRLSISSFPRRIFSVLLVVFTLFGFQKLSGDFMAEVMSFKGSGPGRNSDDREAEAALLLSRRWNRFDVQNDFKLGNLYLRRLQTARARGFLEEIGTNAEKAVDAYTDGLKSNPSYDEFFVARAEALHSLNRVLDSERDLRMALLINPLRKETYLSLDSLLANRGDGGPLRVKSLEEAAFVFPEDIQIHSLLAAALENEGRRADAGIIYEWLLARDLENSVAWEGVKRTVTDIPNLFEEGRSLLSEVRQSARRGNWTDALSQAERLVARFPDYPLARLIAADSAAMKGDDPSAIQYYRDFLLKNPDHADARDNLNKVLARQGKTPRRIGIDGGGPLR